MNPTTNLSPSIVLVTPREEGNIGAVARAMANLGLDRLILVEPAPALGGTARGFGVGGWPILDRVIRAPDLATALRPFRRVVGTTSGRQRPPGRQRILDVRDLAASLLAGNEAAGDVAVVFGPEDSGLTREQLAACHPVVTIPCANQRPTLNLAQAVLLVGWELHRARLDLAADGEPEPTRPPESANAPARASWGDREAVLKLIAPLVRDLGFDHDHIHASVLRDLQLLLDRAELDQREMALLRRLIVRIASRLSTESPR